MKSLSSFNTTAIDNPHVAPIGLFKLELSGLTLYLCDRVWGTGADTCVFNSQLYEPVVVSWDINSGPIDPVNYKTTPGSANLVVNNNTPIGGADTFSDLLNSYDFYYATLTFSQIFEGASAAGDKIDKFKGSVENILDVLSSQVTLVCSGYELDALNKFEHTIIDFDSYPSADPDDVGKMLPVVWGKNKRVPVLAIDVGAVSSLAGDITASATIVRLSDASRLAASGTILVDEEQIDYADKSGDELTNCTRGVNSTTATTHNMGALVGEIKSGYNYGLGCAVNAIHDVYVEGVRQLSGEYTAYTGQSGDEHPTYSNAVIEFAQWPQIQRKIDLSGGQAEYDIFREATNIPLGRVKSLTREGLILDYDDSTTITFQAAPTGSLSDIYVEYEFEFRHFGTVTETWDFLLDGIVIASWFEGTFTQFVTSPLRAAKGSWPASATKTATYRGNGMNGTAFVILSAKVYATSDTDDLTVRGSSKAIESSNVPFGGITSETTAETGTSITFPATPAGNLADIEITYSWGFQIWGDWVFPGTPFLVTIDDINVAWIDTDGSITALMPSSFTVLKGSWQTSITKTASRLDEFRRGYALTISVANQTCYTDDYTSTISLTGNSMADAIVGGSVSADVDGYQDDGSGTYTGTPDALIERPDHIMKHLLMTHCGFISGEIHSTSHGAAGAFYGNDYNLGVVVTDYPNTRDLCHDIANQAKSLEFWEAGEHHLLHVPSGECPVDLSIYKHSFDSDTVGLHHTDRVDLVNTLSAVSDLEWEDNNYRAIVTAIDPPSVTAYGTLEKDRLEFPYISGESHAQFVLNWKKDLWSQPRFICDFAGGFSLNQIERGDVVQFDITSGEYLDKAMGGLITSATKFRILNIKHGITEESITAAELPW